MKYITVILALVLMGCSSKTVKKVNPIEVRKNKVYKCVVNLITREVSATNAEKVCTNIFSKRRVK